MPKEDYGGVNLRGKDEAHGLFFKKSLLRGSTKFHVNDTYHLSHSRLGGGEEIGRRRAKESELHAR